MLPFEGKAEKVAEIESRRESLSYLRLERQNSNSQSADKNYMKNGPEADQFFGSKQKKD